MSLVEFHKTHGLAVDIDDDTDEVLEAEAPPCGAISPPGCCQLTSGVDCQSKQMEIPTEVTLREAYVQRLDFDANEVISNLLWVGSLRACRKPEELAARGIKQIINLSYRPLPNTLRVEDYTILTLDVLDEPSQLLFSCWKSIFAFVDAAAKLQEACLIICHRGVSRSTAAVAAYLIHQKKDLSWENALHQVQLVRHVANPNIEFCRQLEELSHCRGDCDEAHRRYTAMRQAAHSQQLVSIMLSSTSAAPLQCKSTTNPLHSAADSISTNNGTDVSFSCSHGALSSLMRGSNSQSMSSYGASVSVSSQRTMDDSNSESSRSTATSDSKGSSI
jgi:hypothetical protein